MVDIANTESSSVASMVTLPSRGYLYEGKLPEGKVKLRSTTAKEEKLLYGGRGAVGEKINVLLSRCMDLPSGFTPTDMTLGDRMFCIIKIRMLSFGASYPIMARCADCQEQFRHEIDMTDLEVTYYPEDEEFEEPFKVSLPMSGKTVGFRCLRGRDEDAIYKFEKQKKAKGARQLEDDSYTYGMARRIVSIDDEKVDQMAALRFVESMVSKDSMEFRFATEEKDCGIDTELTIECPYCSFLNRLIMPFNDEFFRPKRRTV